MALPVEVADEVESDLPERYSLPEGMLSAMADVVPMGLESCDVSTDDLVSDVDG